MTQVPREVKASGAIFSLYNALGPLARPLDWPRLQGRLGIDGEELGLRGTPDDGDAAAGLHLPQPDRAIVEDSGHLLVVIDIGCKFKKPARYDDLLTIRTTVARKTHVKIVHEYQVLRDGEILAEGHSTLACVDRDGKPQALPPALS